MASTIGSVRSDAANVRDVVTSRAAAARFARVATEAVALVLIVVLPAAFNPFGVLSFEPLKASTLRCLSLLLVWLWCTSRLLSPAPSEVLRSAVTRAGLALVAAATLSTAFSLDSGQSLVGSLDRGMGLLTEVSGLAILLVGADVWRDQARRERAITAVLVGSVVPCGYALAQQVGLDPVTWSEDLGGPASSMGSPTFLAGYLVLVGPFAWYRLMQSARRAASGGANAKGWQSALAYALYLALALTIAVVLVLTTIRAGLVGLMISAAVFGCLLVVRAPSTTRRLAALAVGGCLLLVLGLASVAGGSTPVVLDRLVAVARTATAAEAVPAEPGLARSAVHSVSERLDLWMAAAEAPLHDPVRIVLGFGQETQTAAYEHVERIIRRSLDQRWDRAHNLLMDTWLTGGGLGLLMLLALIGIWVNRVTKALLTGQAEAALVAALLASLAGHVVEQMFAFETVVTRTYFWIVLALGASLVAPEIRAWLPSVTPKRRFALLGIGAAPILVALPMLAAPAVADALFGAGDRADYNGQLLEAASLYETAAAWDPWAEELPRRAALDWQAMGLAKEPGPQSEALLARAAALFREGVKRDHLNSFAHIRLVAHYAAWAEHDAGTPAFDDFLKLGEDACVGAMASGPYRPAGWRKCADVSRLQGATAEAAERLARAQELETR